MGFTVTSSYMNIIDLQLHRISCQWHSLTPYSHCAHIHSIFFVHSGTAAANAHRMLASVGHCTKPPSHSDNSSRRDHIIIISALEKTNSIGEVYVAGQGHTD